MADEEMMLTIITICFQLPLLDKYRRRGASPLFGYRDVILFGDLRQLPPASGRKPFWSTQTFQSFFEIFVLREDRRHERDAAMRKLKELFAWGGCEHHKELYNDEGWEEPWEIHPDVHEAVLEMTLQGIGLSGSTVDLDIGTAIFARHNEKDLWNDAYVRHIEELYWDKGLQAVDIVGYNPVRKESNKEPDTRRSTGLQAPRVLRLRTCKEHRMRTVMLHNENVPLRWSNGTPCRLLAENSWTGLPGSVKRNPDGTFAVTRVVKLEDKEDVPEFNVKVIRDENQTLSKASRYRPEDVCVVPARHDSAFNGYTETHFEQVSLAIAAAMTCHKVQGLTIPYIYFCLYKIFGFGVPYTALTRTPFKKDIAIVGVPPRDIYKALFEKDEHGRDRIERKKIEIDRILSESTDLSEAEQQYYKKWRDRCNREEAINAMLKVCARFKKVKGHLETYANAEKEWKTLTETLQGDAEDRRRILYFRDVAVGWMEAPDVDVLWAVRHNDPHARQKTTTRDENAEGRLTQRRECPKPPEGFEWQAKLDTAKPRKRMQQPPDITDITARHSPEKQADAPPVNSEGGTSSSKKMPNPRYANVVETVDKHTVDVKRMKKSDISNIKKGDTVKKRPASSLTEEPRLSAAMSDNEHNEPKKPLTSREDDPGSSSSKAITPATKDGMSGQQQHEPKTSEIPREEHFSSSSSSANMLGQGSDDPTMPGMEEEPTETSRKKRRVQTEGEKMPLQCGFCSRRGVKT